MGKKKNVTRKDGRIAVQIYVGRKPDGTRNYKTVYGSTQKEADSKALDVKLALKKGIDVTADKDTFKDWADLWKKLKFPEVSNSWKNVCESCLKKLSVLDNVSICKLRPADFQRIIVDLAKNNPSTKKPASRRTLEAVKSVGSQICQMAIDNRVMDHNPVDSVKILNCELGEQRRALTDEERNWIENTPHRAQTAAMIMLYAGLRRGELIPLTWRDIDFDKRTITVCKSVEMIDGHSAIKRGGKTANSSRIIDIPQKLADYLRMQPQRDLLICPASNGTTLSAIGWKRLWNSYLLEINLHHGEFDNCITWKNGKKFDGHKITEKDKCNPNGVPFVIQRFTAHELRHTFATILYFAGVDILTAKEQLGHADVKTTLAIYTHLDSQFKRRSMSKLDDFLSNKTDDASQMQVK